MTQNAFKAPGRMEDRFEEPEAVAVINGQEYKIRDWSARGLSVFGYQISHERGEKLRCSVNYMLDGLAKSFEAGLYVVRVDVDEHVLAAVFIEYDRLAALRMDEIFYPNDMD